VFVGDSAGNSIPTVGKQLHQCRRHVRFRLTRPVAFCFLLAITENQVQFPSDMKKLFALTMLISFAMICSCQKQDSTAERQLAQRKAELDAREKALDEREKALAEREKATASARTISPAIQSRGQVRDPAEVKAERDRRLQQLPPDVQKLIPDPSQVQAERDRIIQRRLSERQRGLEEQRAKIDAAKRENKDAMSAAEQLQRMKSDAAKKAAVSAAAAPPAAEATSAASPAAEVTSPSSLAASPAAEATSPSPSPTPQ
jgi:chromosome segregation ATPase